MDDIMNAYRMSFLRLGQVRIAHSGVDSFAAFKKLGANEGESG
jgi:hypothetical protein